MNNRETVKVSKTEMKVIRAAAGKDLSTAELAKQANCSTVTAWKAVKKMDQLAGLDDSLASYQRLMRARVTDETAVMALETIVGKAATNPHAALQGVSYRDKVLGLVVSKEPDQAPAVQSLFHLPNNSTVTVNIMDSRDKAMQAKSVHSLDNEA